MIDQSGSGGAAPDNSKAAFVLAVIGVSFGGIGAGISLIGGACCGGFGWPAAFVGLVLAIISLALKRTVLGFWAIGVSGFAFAWVILSIVVFGHQTQSAINQAINQSANQQGMRR